MKCEYCGRVARSECESCVSCGAPLPSGNLAIMYDQRILNQHDADIHQLLARPGTNIPINVNNWVDFYREQLTELFRRPVIK